MRFSLLTLSSIGMLSPAESRNIISGFVRPHPRFLIQSITMETPVHFDEYMHNQIEQEEYCQAPGDLFTKQAAKAHVLYINQVREATEAVASTRQYIKKFEGLTRADTLRSASEIKSVWGETVINELKIMIQAVDAKKELYKSRLDHILKTTKQTISEGTYPESITVDVPRDSKVEPISHLANKSWFTLDHHPTAETIDSHSNESWVAMYKAYLEAKKNLEDLSKSLSDISGGAKTVVEQHVKNVRTNNDLKIRWNTSVPTVIERTEKSLNLHDYLPQKYDPVATGVNPDGSENQSDGSGAQKENVPSDFFGSNQDQALAKSAVWLEEGEFNALIKASSGSVSETLTRLTVVLSALHVRRLGLVDAKTLLSALLKSIMGAMDTLRGEIVAELGGISVKLGELAGDAQKVYRQANLFPGVQLDAGYLKGDQDEIDVFEAKLKEAVAENAHSEIPHRINLVANVMHRLHAHLLAFLVAHQGAVSFPDVQSAQENNGKPFTFDTSNAGTEYNEVKTSILSAKDAFFELLGKNAATSLTPESIQKMKEVLSKHQERSRVASECLLYGRVDALGRNLPRHDSDQQGAPKTVDDVCKTTHALGTKIMAQLFPIEPHSSSDSASPNGGGDRPLISK